MGAVQATASEEHVLSVGEFMEQARQIVEETMQPVWVSGEVLDFFCAHSGHWFFALRDLRARVDCVMLARDNRYIDAMPQTGDNVWVMAHPTLYVPRGRFQLAVRFMRQRQDVGALYAEFAQRRQRLFERGWLATEHKKRLPLLPQTVGIVCSPVGAAVQDVIRTLRLRWSAVSIIVYPCPAQGHDAAQKIATAITTADCRRDCDVLIVCRGGGGIEDLWAFNDEAVTEAIFHATTPIITGIGHEVDETLADAVADVRTATPTAAAVQAVPEASQLWAHLRQQYRRASALMVAMVATYERFLHRVRMTGKAAFLHSAMERCQALQARLRLAIRLNDAAWARRLGACTPPRPPLAPAAWQLGAVRERLIRLQSLVHWSRLLTVAEGKLALVDPLRPLQRGYSIAYDQQGRVITDAKMLTRAQRVRVQLATGGAYCVIEETFE